MRFIFLSACLFLATGIFAQQTTPKQKQIVRMMELVGTKKILETMKVSLKQSYQKNMPEVAESFWNEFFDNMSSDDLINLIIPIYDKHFTEEDINGLVAFYETPLGKKMIDKLPLIMQESMAVGQQWGKDIGEKILARIEEEKKRKG